MLCCYSFFSLLLLLGVRLVWYYKDVYSSLWKLYYITIESRCHFIFDEDTYSPTQVNSHDFVSSSASCTWLDFDGVKYLRCWLANVYNNSVKNHWSLIFVFDGIILAVVMEWKINLAFYELPFFAIYFM